MNPTYYKKLEDLVRKINENPLSAKSLLQEAPSWQCDSLKERELFDELINKAEDYIKLEEKLIKGGYTIMSDPEHIEMRQLLGWFTDLYLYDFKQLKELFSLLFVDHDSKALGISRGLFLPKNKK